MRQVFSSSFEKKKAIPAIEQIILPLLMGMGNLISQNRFSISQEHIISSMIKEKLYSLLSKTSSKTKSKERSIKVVLATPEGDYHEIGLLMTHVILKENGIQSLYLGANMPKNELCETCLRYGATHLVLGSTVSRKNGAREELPSYLHYLNQHLPKSVTFWLGGRNFQSYQIDLTRPHLQFFSPLDIDVLLKAENN